MEVHLSSYDHNHKKRFRDSQKVQQLGMRDERQRRDKLREEKEMARYAKLVEAQKHQEQSTQAGAASPAAAASAAAAAQVAPAAAVVAPVAPAATRVPAERSALKFGLSMKTKPGAVKKGFMSKKTAAPPQKLASVFGAHEEDEDQT
eukprot:TRINITY_DN4738_c0_g2_i2.p2 TRINITY_DN4738_c0_g2~~TRINITY_DN4738_c0_g2_i2.p2  ORF type:complete len:147 (+),score=24.15 TRINITY_DN4738_c0_g2_i2:460-900(+)